MSPYILYAISLITNRDTRATTWVAQLRRVAARGEVCDFL